MKIVEFRDVSLRLDGRTILAGVNLEINSGEFVGVLGPNGAGKTTLMRAILGLVPPTRGEISVLGEPVSRGNAAIGYMPQVHGAPAATGLRGWDFVASALDGHRLGMPLHGRKQNAWRSTAYWRWSAPRRSARRPLARLSGGERQRLLLAQTLIGRPRLLMLDEPLISLDPHRQSDVVALVKSLAGGVRPDRAVQRARAEPFARRDRPRALSGAGASGARLGRRGHHRPGAVAALWRAD